MRLNRRPVEKPGARVRTGDILTIATGETLTLGGTVRVIRINALAPRRGPAEEARLLYEDVP